MKVYGVDLAEGSYIANPVLPSGETFPSASDMAELFLKHRPRLEFLYMMEHSG